SLSNEGWDGMTIRAVVLTGWIARNSRHSHVDSNLEIGDSGRRVEPDGLPQKVPIRRGYGKYRDSRGGGDCSVTYEQQADASRSLTVCGYLGEQRSPRKIPGIGQADLPARCRRKVGRQSPTIGIEDEVPRNRHGNIRARVGGRGPCCRNASWVHGAAGRVRRLWPGSENVNAVLGGERSYAKRQCA